MLIVQLAHQLLGLEPGIVLAGLLGLGATVRGRHGLTIPAVAVLGSVVVWAVFGFLTGKTLGWLRYSIAEIPLVTVLALAVLSRQPAAEERSTSSWLRLPLSAEHPFRRAGAFAPGLLMVLAVAAAVPVGFATMVDPSVNPSYGGEAWQLQPVLTGKTPVEVYTPDGQYEAGRQAASYLDALHLARGKVLVDGAMGFPIILESNNPSQFVTTPDRDFQEVLLDPVSFGVEYLLVPEAVGYQSLDAINRAYPGIYAHGAAVATTLTAQFGAGGNNWRLYQVTP